MITEFNGSEFDQARTPYITDAPFFMVSFRDTFVEFDGRDDFLSSLYFLTPPTLSSTPTSLLLTYDNFSGISSAPVALLLADDVGGYAEYRTTWDQFFRVFEPRIVEFRLNVSSGTLTTISRIDFLGLGNSISGIGFDADRLTAVTVPEPQGLALVGGLLLAAFLVVRRRRARAV